MRDIDTQAYMRTCNVIILQSAWFYADIPEEIACFLKPFRNKSV